MGNIKEVKIKNQTYYFFNDMINITNCDPNLLKIDKKPYKNIDIQLLIFIFGKVDGHFEEKKNGSKYLILDSRDKNK